MTTVGRGGLVVRALVGIAAVLGLGACGSRSLIGDAGRDAVDVVAADVPPDVGEDAGPDADVEDAAADVVVEDAPTDAPTDAPATALRALARFDPAMGQLPEGLALRGGDAYVGFAPTGRVVRVTPGGAASLYATFPTAPGGQVFLLGLAFDTVGNLYGAVTSFAPTVTSGVYRVGPGGGAAGPFVTQPGLVFPNGLAFDAAGNLFTTDSTGAVYRTTPDGTTLRWATDPLLIGDRTACGGSSAPFEIGANGIVHAGTEVLVTNTDRAMIVRIPILPTGLAGAASVAVGPDCARLKGADGLAADRGGALLVAVNTLDSVVRVTPGGPTTTLDMGRPLDGPASLAVGDLSGERALFVTNSAFASAATGAMPDPALLVRALP